MKKADRVFNWLTASIKLKKFEIYLSQSNVMFKLSFIYKASL